MARPGADPADLVTLDESVSMALLVVLEALTPAERTAFLLRDVFGLSYEEIADVVGRPVAAVRQLASRGRRRVHDDQPRFQPTRAQQRELLDAFTQLKTAEWEEFCAAVTDWHRDRYLRAIP